MSLTPTEQTPLLTASGTHPGETGKNNEDSFALQHFRAPDGAPVTLAVICDGIGGHRAGEVASRLAIQTIVEQVTHSDGRSYRQAFSEAVQQASQSIARQAEGNLDYAGMGTTCAIAVIHDRKLYTGYVGDSRLYLYRGATQIIRQISVDHSWLQAAVEHGLIRPEEASAHPNQHVLLRHIGGRQETRPDFRLKLAEGETPEQAEAHQGLPLEPGDTVLICSDGLSDLVATEEIGVALREYPPAKAVEELITLARRRGGYDNITVLVVRVPAG